MKAVTVPILNHEYKVVVCWGDLKHLRKNLTDHHYNPDHVTKTFIEEQTEKRRGVTFREHRCYPTIWINADLLSYLLSQLPDCEDCRAVLTEIFNPNAKDNKHE